MTGSRRGFARERHPILKVGICVFALAGFTGGWAAFSASHDEPKPAVAAVSQLSPTRTPTATATPTSRNAIPPVGTPAPAIPDRTPTPAPSAEATPSTTKPNSTIAPKKKSRGS